MTTKNETETGNKKYKIQVIFITDSVIKIFQYCFKKLSG